MNGDTSKRGRSKHPSAPKGLPRAAIAEAVKSGEMTVSEASRHWECARTTVYSILEDFGASRKQLDAYKSARADVLADLGLKATGLLHKLIDRGSEEDVVNRLQPGQIGGLVAATTTLMGVAFDKERLERGQSTANVQSLLHVAQQRADAECCGARRVDTDSRDGDTG